MARGEMLGWGATWDLPAKIRCWAWQRDERAVVALAGLHLHVASVRHGLVGDGGDGAAQDQQLQGLWEVGEPAWASVWGRVAWHGRATWVASCGPAGLGGDGRRM